MVHSLTGILEKIDVKLSLQPAPYTACRQEASEATTSCKYLLLLSFLRSLLHFHNPTFQNFSYFFSTSRVELSLAITTHLSPLFAWACLHACILANKCDKVCICMCLHHHSSQFLPKWKNIEADRFLAPSEVTIFTLQLLYLPLSSSSSPLPGFTGPTHT